MSEIDWTVKGVLFRIGMRFESTEKLAKELGVSKKTITTKIKSLGYQWNGRRNYEYIGEEPEPSDVDFRTLFDASEKIVKQEVLPSKTEVNDSHLRIKRRVDRLNNTSEYDSMIDMLLEGKPKIKKLYKGFYIDEDIAAIIDSVGERKKSELVNQALRKVFSEKGLL